MFNNIKFQKTKFSQHDVILQVLKSFGTNNKVPEDINLSTPTDLSKFKEIRKIDLDKYNHASFKYEKLKEEIESFQNNLSDEFDVVVKMTSLGKEIIMLVDDIRFQNPDMLYFYGTINGQKSELIQHQFQLNFLLMATKKEEPVREAQRIGFFTTDNDSNQ